MNPRFLPVLICKPGAVGSHAELAQKLAEPLLDLDALLSAFVLAGSLSTSEAVAVVHPGVVKARHLAGSSVNEAARIIIMIMKNGESS